MEEHEHDAGWAGSPSGPQPRAAASVVVELAVAAGPAPAPAASAAHSEPLVYVVDDDPALRDSLRWLIESEGYRVLTYSTAERFLQACNPFAAACLVLDVRLPGMSGLELQRELVRRGETLPIIFMTGHAAEQNARDVLKNGAFHFLEKPFQDAQLLTVIAQAARSQYGAGAPKHCSHC
jgi:FixJ family two-component response regulator